MAKIILKNITGKLRSIDFWLMSILVVVVLAISPVGTLCLKSEIPLYKAAVTMSEKELILAGEYMSSYYIVMNAHCYEWFVIISPVVFCFTAVRSLRDSLFGGIYNYTVTRISKKKNIKIEFISSIICTALTVLVGMLVFTAVAYMFFPNLESISIPKEFSEVRKIYGITEGARLLSYIKMLGNVLMVSILMAELSMLFLVCFKDVFYALNVPLLILYLGSKLLNLHLNILRKKYGVMYSFRKLFPELMNPYYLFISMPEGFPAIAGVNDIWYFFGLAAGIVLLAILTIKVMGKYEGYQ